MATLAKTALRFGATLVGHCLIPQLGGFLGGVLADKLPEILPESIQEQANKLIESASEKLAEITLGEPLNQLGVSLKNKSPELEGLYRTALRDALVAIQSTLPNDLREEASLWFINWKEAVRIPLEEELPQASVATEEDLEIFFRETLLRLDDIGQRRRNHNLSIKPSIDVRTLSARLLQILRAQLPDALKTSYRLLLAQPENVQARNEAVLICLDEQVASPLVTIKTQTAPTPEIHRLVRDIHTEIFRNKTKRTPLPAQGHEQMHKQFPGPKRSVETITPPHAALPPGQTTIGPRDWLIGTPLARAAEGLVDTAWTAEFHHYSESLLVSTFHKRRHEIEVRIVKKYELKPSREEQAEFERLNRIRKNQGRLEMFPSTRFRLLSLPKMRRGKVLLDVAPFDFVTFSVIRDSNDESLVSRSLERIRQATPEHVRPHGNADSSTNLYSKTPFVPMGIELVLITSDNKSLLRQRGQSVQTEARKWDVSVSGSLGEAHRGTGSGNLLDLSRAVADLVREEIGTLRGSPAEVDFLGLHINYKTGATDVLASWRLEATENDLRQYLKPRTKGPETFPTKVSAQQPFSSDTNNKIVGWTEAECLSAVNSIHRSGGRFIPEAVFCLVRALQFQ